VLAADGDDLGGGRVGAGQGLGDAGRAVARGDADDDGVGNLAGGSPPVTVTVRMRRRLAIRP
jgi:hypothetical protein